MTHFPRHISLQSMPPTFAMALLGSPLLQHIRSNNLRPSENDKGSLGIFDGLDEVEKSEEGIIGRIRSFRHGNNEELLHARLNLFHTQADDILQTSDHTSQTPNYRDRYHYTQNGIRRVRIFTRLPAKVWQDFTYYRGLAVPLEVVDKMMRVEGAKEGDWEARDIEVKAETWKVLEDWRAGITATG